MSEESNTSHVDFPTITYQGVPVILDGGLRLNARKPKMDEQKVKKTIKNIANVGGAVVAALAALSELPVLDPIHIGVFAAGLFISIFGGHQSSK